MRLLWSQLCMGGGKLDNFDLVSLSNRGTNFKEIILNFRSCWHLMIFFKNSENKPVSYLIDVPMTISQDFLNFVLLKVSQIVVALKFDYTTSEVLTSIRTLVLNLFSLKASQRCRQHFYPKRNKTPCTVYTIFINH